MHAWKRSSNKIFETPSRCCSHVLAIVHTCGADVSYKKGRIVDYLCVRAEKALHSKSYVVLVFGVEGLFHILGNILTQRVPDSYIVDKWQVSLVRGDVFHLCL